ncbi:MAG: AAA family ATPase [Nitrososphaerales archaeon]
MRWHFRAISVADRYKSAMRNPFNPGSGVPPPYLAGRENHLKTFERALESIDDGHIENMIVHGLRGTGKTVLLTEFNKISVKKGFLPIRRSQFSEKYCDPEEFEKALKYDLRVAIETFSKISWFKNKMQAGISYLKPKSVGVPDLVYYEPSYGRSKSVPFEDYLKKYLSDNWTIFEKAGFKGVIFLYDEFHTVIDDKRNRKYVLSDFLAAINEVQKDGKKYFAVLSGLPNLQLNVKKGRSYSERMYKSLEVGNLDREDAGLAIEKAPDGSGYKFEKPLIQSLIEGTSGYPYFLQLYGKEIISNVNSSTLSIRDYDKIKPLLIKQLDADFFEPRFELASDDEQTALCKMATFEGSINIPFEFILRKARMSKSAVSRSLIRLERKGMVYNHKRGVYRFSLPMFKEFLGRKCES